MFNDTNLKQKDAARALALYSLSREIAEIGDDLDRILNTAARHVCDYIGEASTISILGKNGDTIVNMACYHSDTTILDKLNELLLTQEFPVNSSILGKVIASREPLLIPSLNLKQEGEITNPVFREFVDDMGFYCLLVVPIMGREGIHGTISLSRRSGDVIFTDDEQKLLMEFARHTGLAIDHSLLVSSLRGAVAEMKSAETALHDSELRFQSIFEATSLGVKIMDVKGKILHTNRAFQHMIGYSNQEIVGQHFSVFIHPRESNIMKQHFDSLLGEGSSGYRLEHRLVHSDGSIVWVNTSFTAVHQNQSLDSLDFVFGITEDISRRKKLEAEMREMKARFHDNLENERLRLAQDIHDGPMQVLYSVIFQLESLRDGGDSQFEDSLKKVRTDIQDVIDELRFTTQELRPPTLSDFGLEKAIRSHADSLIEKYPELDIELSLAQDQQVLPEKIRLALFRIYQSCIMNTLRHAQARHVYVRFTYDIEEITLEIEDDGQGFIVPSRWVEFLRNGHYGLAGVAERVKILDGQLIVRSEPGEGTLVRVIIPSQFSEFGD